MKPKEKSFQKFTENSQKLNPDSRSDIQKEIMDKLGQLENIELRRLRNNADEAELAEINQRHNYTWQENHQKIKLAVLSSLTKTGSMPTVTSISKITRLSRVTITEHLRNLNLADLYKDDFKKYEILVESLLGTLFLRAHEDKDTQAAKVFFDILSVLTSRYKERREDNNLNTVNLIQQNFTLMKNFFSSANDVEKAIVKEAILKLTEDK